MEHIIVDKAEIIIFLTNKNHTSRYSLVSKDITRIHVKKFVDYKFGIIPSKSVCIEFESHKYGSNIVLKKAMCPKTFDQNVKLVEEYAKANSVPFSDYSDQELKDIF